MPDLFISDHPSQTRVRKVAWKSVVIGARDHGAEFLEFAIPGYIGEGFKITESRHQFNVVSEVSFEYLGHWTGPHGNGTSQPNWVRSGGIGRSVRGGIGRSGHGRIES